MFVRMKAVCSAVVADDSVVFYLVCYKFLLFAKIASSCFPVMAFRVEYMSDIHTVNI